MSNIKHTFTVCLCRQAVYLGTGQRATRSGDTLAVCHRLCGLSTYGLKADEHSA